MRKLVFILATFATLVLTTTASATTYACPAYSEHESENSVLYQSLRISVSADSLRDIRLRVAVTLDNEQLAAVDRLSAHEYACSVAETIADKAWEPDAQHTSFRNKLGRYRCRRSLVEAVPPEYEGGSEKRIEAWSCGIGGEDANRVTFLGTSETG